MDVGKSRADCRAYYQSHKEAIAAQKKKYREENSERIAVLRKTRYAARKEAMRQAAKERYERNKDAVKAQSKKYRDANPLRVAEAAKRRAQRNRPARNAQEAKRNAIKKRAFPSWADRKQIEEAYALAKVREEETGFVWHVDHIVPLQNALVCGLHVPVNLQLLPAADNTRKHNNFDPQTHVHTF